MSVKKDNVDVQVENTMVDMKYLRGKLSMVAEVKSDSADCSSLDISRCMSSSRDFLAKSAYFKALAMNGNKIRLSFHFFIGINRDLGLCSVRVAVKRDKAYEPR